MPRSSKHRLYVAIDVHDDVRAAASSAWGLAPRLGATPLPLLALRLDFLYLADAAVEDSAAWRSYNGGELDAAQVASHAALQKLHLQTDAPGFAASLEDAPNPRDYRNKLNAPVAASATLADMALTPLALFCGIEVRYEDSEQPRLGPTAPTAMARPLLYGSADAPGLLDGGRFSVRFGGVKNGTTRVLGESEADAALLRCSLADIARHSDAACSSDNKESISYWTLRLSAAEYEKLNVACKRAAACVAEAQAQDVEDAQQSRDAMIRAAALEGLDLPAFDMGAFKLQAALEHAAERHYHHGYHEGGTHWSAHACAFSGAPLGWCEATHIVARSVGGVIKDAHRAMQRPDVGEASGPAERLGLLDARLFAARRTIWRKDLEDEPAELHSVQNGFFLEAGLRRLYEKHVFVVTPAKRLLHITRPELDVTSFSLRSAPKERRRAHEREVGFDTAVQASLDNVKMRNVHLAYFATLFAVFGAYPFSKFLETWASAPTPNEFAAAGKRAREELELEYARRLRRLQQQRDEADSGGSRDSDDSRTSYESDDWDWDALQEMMGVQGEDLRRLVDEEELRQEEEMVYRACIAVLVGHLEQREKR